MITHSLPPHGGSGLKYYQCVRQSELCTGLPPHGGSGLKLFPVPAMCGSQGLPPHGGSGLKWLRSNSISRYCGLPPHGGSGLKYKIVFPRRTVPQSPSTRREWIEMRSFFSMSFVSISLPPHGGSGLKSSVLSMTLNRSPVSLHTEGVD